MAFAGEGFSAADQPERLGQSREAYSLEAAIRTIRFFGYTASAGLENKHVDNPFLMQLGNFVGTTDKKGILQIPFENEFPTKAAVVTFNIMPFEGGPPGLTAQLVALEAAFFRIEGPKSRKIFVFFHATGF